MAPVQRSPGGRNSGSPGLHGIFGGAHEQPNTAGQSRSSYAIKAAVERTIAGTRASLFRLEGDYVRTGFFSQSQNNFQLAGGVVLHF